MSFAIRTCLGSSIASVSLNNASRPTCLSSGAAPRPLVAALPLPLPRPRPVYNCFCCSKCCSNHLDSPHAKQQQHIRIKRIQTWLSFGGRANFRRCLYRVHAQNAFQLILLKLGREAFSHGRCPHQTGRTTRQTRTGCRSHHFVDE